MLDVDLPKMRENAEKKLVFFYDIVPRITSGVHRLMDNIKEGFDDVYVVGIGKHLHVSDFEVNKNADKKEKKSKQINHETNFRKSKKNYQITLEPCFGSQ